MLTDDLDVLLNSVVDEIEVQRQIHSCMILNASTGLGKSTELVYRIY